MGASARAVRSDHIVFAAILSLAALLRLTDITQPLVDAFSWREASTAMMADNFHQRSANVLYPEVSWTGPGPSYQGREFQVVSWITGMLFHLVGWRDWLGRLVAAAFGLWSVVALHRLTERVWDRPHAHAAALMLAVLPGAVLIDRAFLPDPAMLAFVLTGAWLFVAWVQERGTLRLAGAAVFIALGLLAKLPGAVVLAPLLYLAAPLLRRDPKSRLPLAVTLVGVAAPVIAYYLWAVHLGRTYPPYHIAGAGYLWEDARDALRRLFYLPAGARIAETWFLTLPVALLVAVGAIADFARRDWRFWFFHVWAVAGGGLFVLAGREITNNPWNLMIFAPPSAALAGRGLILAAGYGRTAGSAVLAHARALAILAVVLWAGQTSLGWMKTPYAATAQTLGEALHEVSAPGDLVIAVAPDVGDPIAIYYSRRRGWVFPAGGGERDWTVLPPDTAAAFAELEALRAQGADWFGVTKDASDGQGRLFFDHLAGFVGELNVRYERIADHPDYAIWRLSGPGRAAPGGEPPAAGG